MAARTTSVGAIISVILIFFYSSQNNLKKLILKLFFPLVSGMGIMLFLYQTNEKIKKMIEYGFEIFINLFSNKGATSASTEDLKNMYSIKPDNLKTWMVGDGKLTDGIFAYYKGTDVGYYRIIFYVGIIGLIFIFLYKIYLLYNIKKICSKELESKNRKLIILGVSIFVLEIACNFKGMVDFNRWYYFIFFYLYNRRKREVIVEYNKNSEKIV